MHILLVPSWYPATPDDVAGVFFRGQALALSRAGHQVGVISPHFRSIKCIGRPRASTGDEVGIDGGVATYRYHGQHLTPGSSRSGTGRWMKIGMALFNRYRAEQGLPDVLHAHAALMGGVLASDISLRSGVPYVVTEHSSSYARNALRSWQLDDARRAMAGASARIVVSPQLGSVLESRLGRAASPWAWVPNMVDSAFLVAPLRTTGQQRPLRFLNVALLTEKKGHSHLLEAFAHAFGDSHEAELRIGGDGPMRAMLELTAERLGVSESVRFLGQISRTEVLREIVEADVFVLSSPVETFGVVLIEALACGTPVIATRSGGPECIVEPEDGLLVEPGEARQLADAMLQMRERVSDYDAINIRERCRARFAEESVVARLEDVYHQVVFREGLGC